MHVLNRILYTLRVVNGVEMNANKRGGENEGNEKRKEFKGKDLKEVRHDESTSKIYLFVYVLR